MATVTKWDSFQQMERWESEFARMFGRTAAGAWTPAVDVEQTPTELVFTFDLPGMPRDDIGIELHERTLTVSGSREQKRDEKHEGYHARERVYGQFARSFTLPHAVKPGEIRAEFADGVLSVHMPRPAETRPQRIEIAGS